MPNVIGGLRELRDDLIAADLRASIDLDRVNPPAVWLTVDRLEDFTGDGGCEAVVALWLIVGDQSDEKALESLGVLLDATLAALDALSLPYAIEPITTARVVGPYPNGAAELPAYRVLTSITV